MHTHAQRYVLPHVFKLILRGTRTVTAMEQLTASNETNHSSETTAPKNLGCPDKYIREWKSKC